MSREKYTDSYIDVDHIHYNSFEEAMMHAYDNRIIDVMHSNGVSHRADRTCTVCENDGVVSE